MGTVLLLSFTDQSRTWYPFLCRLRISNIPIRLCGILVRICIRHIPSKVLFPRLSRLRRRPYPATRHSEQLCLWFLYFFHDCNLQIVFFFFFFHTITQVLSQNNHTERKTIFDGDTTTDHSFPVILSSRDWHKPTADPFSRADCRCFCPFSGLPF